MMKLYLTELLCRSKGKFSESPSLQSTAVRTELQPLLLSKAFPELSDRHRPAPLPDLLPMCTCLQGHSHAALSTTHRTVTSTGSQRAFLRKEASFFLPSAAHYQFQTVSHLPHLPRIFPILPAAQELPQHHGYLSPSGRVALDK